MFWKNDSEKRSIGDILTPKGDIKQSGDGVIDCEMDSGVCDEKLSLVNSGINPLSCFGMEEEKTEKWLGKCVKFWYCIMSFFWFLFGALTFAPIIFISNKVNVIFKNKRRSLLASGIIYLICLALLIIFL